MVIAHLVQLHTFNDDGISVLHGSFPQFKGLIVTHKRHKHQLTIIGLSMCAKYCAENFPCIKLLNNFHKHHKQVLVLSSCSKQLSLALEY